MGMKVGDDKTIPLCVYHHDAIHSQGQQWFEGAYKRDLEKTAAELWKHSPHGVRFRAEQSSATPKSKEAAE